MKYPGAGHESACPRRKSVVTDLEFWEELREGDQAIGDAGACRRTTSLPAGYPRELAFANWLNSAI